MTHLRRPLVVVPVLAAGLALVVATAPDAAAKRRRRARPAELVEIVAPLGLQGIGGASPVVVFPFAVASVTGAATDVEFQYGVDVNGDGSVTDDEFRAATEDRLDQRNTRGDHAPQLYATSSTDRATHGFVWAAAQDLPNAGFVRLEYALDENGRFLPDPDNPGGYLFASAPWGAGFRPGVRVRARTVAPADRRHRAGRGAWVMAPTFELENRSPPSMTIDDVTPGATTLVRWTAFDPDSEDLNGNGALDIADGEDANGNGVLDAERVGVAFDFHATAKGEGVASMTPAELAALRWYPCTRDETAGDNDRLLTGLGVWVPETGPLSGVPAAAPGVGRTWTYAWDAARDVGLAGTDVILRARPFDATRMRGEEVVRTTVVRVGP